ncbi:hypothetical protein D3C80_1358770 [compost metagenome]
MIVKIEETDLLSALNFLQSIHARVRFTSKNGRHYIEFPPGMSKDGSEALNLLGRADQMVHQEYLPMELNLRVEQMRNKYNTH